MDLLLLTVAIIAVLAAAAFAALAWRLLEDQRRRSAARVSALTAAIDDARSSAVPTRGIDLLFAPRSSAAARTNPLIAVAAGAGTTALVVLAAAVAMSGNAAGDGSRVDDRAPASPSESPAPLELISMRHARNGSTLTVSGLVRNPRNGLAVAGISAVITAYNRAGGLAGSGRAPLDYTTVEPGDESPFVVTIPRVADVGRYRVSFRIEERVVRHVDRRSNESRPRPLDASSRE